MGRFAALRRFSPVVIEAAQPAGVACELERCVPELSSGAPNQLCELLLACYEDHADVSRAMLLWETLELLPGFCTLDKVQAG